MLIGCFSMVGLAAKKVAVDKVYDFEAETLELNSGVYTIEGNPLYNRDTSTSKPGNGELEENATALDLHRRNLAKDIDGVLPAASGATNYNAAPLGVIESYAFEYAINGTKEYGQKAVDAMSNYVDTVVFDTTNGNAYNNWSQMEYTIGAMTFLRTT